MKEIKIIYFSQTGNTEQMAEAIKRGIEKEGKAAVLYEVGNIQPDILKDDSVFALGCPAMGDEVLEELSMEPFVAGLEQYLEGKQAALFGAYGWGDGQWMRDWEERMVKHGAVLVESKGMVSCEEPDDQILLDCEKLGKKLADLTE